MPLPPIVPEGGVNHPLAVAWMAIQKIVGEDANLKRVVKTLRLMDGDANELAPPTEAELPWLRIRPTNSPMEIGSESEWGVDLRFIYEIAVRGSRVVDLMNVWGFFVSSLSQSTETPFGNVQAYYRSAGIRVIEITQAAIGPVVPDVRPGAPTPPPFMIARGLVRGQVFFNN